MEVHHIGYAVRDIQKSTIEFKKNGFKNVGELCIDNQRNVLIQLMKNKEWLIELVAPILNTNSPILNILEKNNNTPYHLCYCTASITKKIKELRDNSYTLIESPKPAIAFNGRLVAFLYHNDIGIIELLECS